MTGAPSPLANDAVNFGGTEAAFTQPAGCHPSHVADFADAISIDELVSRCTSFGGVQGFFARREQELAEALCLGYAIFVRVRGNNDAIETLRRHPLLQHRLRAPSKGNPAHLAMLLVCRPTDQPQRKTCSDYASALIWAADQKLPPSQFEQAWKSTNLAQCKKHVRERRRQIRVASESSLHEWVLCLEVRLCEDKKATFSRKWPISEQACQALFNYKGGALLAAPDTSIAAFHYLLRELLETLENIVHHDGRSETASTSSAAHPP